MAATKVKICGLTRPGDVSAAVAAGAAYVGFVFFEKSPRHLEVAQARELALNVPAGLCKVALTVNASDDTLEAILSEVPIDMLQLHGSEDPERVSQIRDKFGLPVIKALGVATKADLHAVEEYAQAADQLLIDAKPPKESGLPGGNGLSFDWRLIAGRRWPLPWMLAGGLTPENVGAAVRLTGAGQVDVSTGVESAPGIKDVARIKAFARAAGALWA